MTAMTRLALTLAVSAAALALSACGVMTCTDVGCESSVVVDYGDLVVNEPYSLTLNPGGQTISVVCLSNDPDAEPLPEWLECDAGGFEITGERAENTTLTVAVVRVASQEVVIANALVPLTVESIDQPNGEDCEPACYRRTGSTAGL